MSSKKIVYFDQVFAQFKQLLEQHKPEGFELYFYQEINEEDKEQCLREADYWMVATHRLDQNILNYASQVKLIQKTGIGVDNIDLDTARQMQLPVSNTPGGNTTAVAELTILLTLSLYRKLPLLNEATKKGRWMMWELRPSSYEMEGKTHGIIGFGNIGREVAKRSRAFGTRIVYYDVSRISENEEKKLKAEYVGLEQLLKVSDIVSLHLPLLSATKGLIRSEQLKMMKPSAVLINVSRGGIVDETALYEALTNNEIAGAGIDVWETEPVRSDHPLLSLEQVIATPHIGAGTRDTLDRVLSIAFSNIERVENGQPPQFVVNGI